MQRILGFDRYLFLFSRYTIRRMEQNKHEAEFIHFLGLLPDEGTLLDIGANIGVTSVHMARKKPHAQVLAFEPMPENAKALYRVVQHFGLKNVRLFNQALGATAGTLKLIMPIQGKARMQGLSRVYNEETDTQDSGQIYLVPVSRLDDMPEMQAINKINGIKIDVENFEYEVFQGGTALLRKHMPLIYCELWENEKRQMVMSLMKDLGYTVKIYDGHTLVDYTGQRVFNFFFVPAAH